MDGIEQQQFHAENHYVPQFYLKNWAASTLKIWVYRTLVPDKRVPIWKQQSIAGIARHSHLYTSLLSGTETDEVEKWFNKEFESPAREPIRKAISGEQLCPDDWYHMARFLAAQDVRTPARLIENIIRWQETLPRQLEEVLQEAKMKFEKPQEIRTKMKLPFAEHIPLKVTTNPESDGETATIRAEAIIGRGLWLFSIQHLLTRTADALHKHRWTILSPADGYEWITSDDPVIRLNYNNPNGYDFKGGWGSPGTEILLPLGPQHLLYTRVGQKPQMRGTKVPKNETEGIIRMIAEHSHRMIFSSKIDDSIPLLKNRIADLKLFKKEQEEWKNWRSNQTNAELELKRD
jgi:hypothetical protein